MPDSRVQVIIVDDDDTMRYMLTRELRKRDPEARQWEVVTAATPEEGLAVVSAAAPARPILLLADYDLRAPMTGADLIEEVRRARPDATLVLFSGHPESALTEAIKRARPAAFLEKTSRIEILAEGIVDLIPKPSPETPAEPPAPAPADESGSAVEAADPRAYRTLLDNVPDAIFLLDAQGRVRTWSRSAEHITGHSEEEILGRSFSVLYPPSDLADHEPLFDLRVASEDGRVEDTAWRVRKDGTMFWANVTLTAIRAEDGTVSGFSGIMRDLTDQHHHEEALRRSEERYRLLVESVKDYAIFQLDPTGRIVNWNKGAEAIKGYTADEIIGRHFSTFYTDQDRASGRPHKGLRRALANGRYEAEGWRVRKDGSLFWASVVITALFDEDGSLRGFAKVTRDLTERKRDEEALRKRAAALKELTRELEAFNYTVAHDLRAPLRAITHFTKILTIPSEQPTSEQEREEIFQIIHTNAVRMSQLVEDLLVLSRATTGDITREHVDLSKVASTVFHEVTKRAGATRAEVRVQPGLTAEADARMIRIVLENLISNAVKFSRDRPHPLVEVGLTDTQDGPAFFVKDNGVGFDASRADLLFRPFQRLHASSEFEGTGIGLATVARIVERHGGRVWAEARPGEGATFHFTLSGNAEEAEDEEDAALPGRVRTA